MSPLPATKRFKASESTGNVRVNNMRPLLPPAILSEELPVTDEVAESVSAARAAIAKAITGEDDRLVVVVGPCSIHDVEAAKAYAQELVKIRDEIKDDVLVVMRVYFEKPRTTVGWKGLINDPELDGSFQINKGLRLARKLLIDLNTMGLPVGTEFLDSISPQFTSDLVAWGAIGARTTESQIHRELASGLSCPIGFKNGTGGDTQVAIDALRSAREPHSFLGVSEQGLAAIVSTNGNPDCHVILRGGSDGPNYAAEHVLKCKEKLTKANLGSVRLMIDCSHGNSLKQHKNQPIVAQSVADQVAAGSDDIFGLMIESNINEGNQKLQPGVTDVSSLKYGISVTDACIDVADTRTTLHALAKAVRARRAAKTE